MAYDIKTNFPEVKRAILFGGKQARFAVAVAFTRTIVEVKKAEIAEMSQVFDAPTRYTLSSLYAKTATKEDLSARVWFKDSNRPNHYLLPEVYGGPRTLKRYEEIMVRAGMLDRTERTVPGAGAQLDAFGNMSRGQIVQILSQLRAFNLAGSDANATSSARSRKKRAQVEYFLSRGPRRGTVGRGSWKSGEKVQHLPRGIYLRRKFAQGSAVQPVLLFVKGTSYKARFQFDEIATRIATERVPYHYRIALAQAIATAR